MVIVGVDIWDMFWEILVPLGVDFEVVGVVLVETPGVAILEVNFLVTAVTLIETKEIVVNGFTVLLLVLLDLLVLLEGTVSDRLPLELCRGTVYSGCSAAPASASTCSAPRSSAAQAPHAPRPIVRGTNAASWAPSVEGAAAREALRARDSARVLLRPHCSPAPWPGDRTESPEPGRAGAGRGAW